MLVQVQTIINGETVAKIVVADVSVLRMNILFNIFFQLHKVDLPRPFISNVMQCCDVFGSEPILL